jgi:hypothetical protein
MLKKMFVVFLVCSFVSNTFALSALAFDTKPAVKNAQIEELAVDVTVLLEKLKSMDMSEWPYPAGFLNNNIEEYQFLVERYLQEIADDNDLIAPGCMPPYLAAFLDIYILTPIMFGFTLNELFYSDIDVTCFWASATGTLWIFTRGLIRWTDYRICAIENSDDPNQDTIVLLEQDKAFLEQISFYALLLTAVWGSDCTNLFGDIFENIGRN